MSDVYVSRNNNNEINLVTWQSSSIDANETIDENHPDVVAYLSPTRYELYRVRDIRRFKFKELDIWYSARPPTIPSGSTQQELDDYQDALRNLPNVMLASGSLSKGMSDRDISLLFPHPPFTL